MKTMMSNVKNTLDGLRAHEVLPKKTLVEVKIKQEN